MTLVVLGHLRIGVRGCITHDHGHLREPGPLRSAQPLGAEVDAVAACRVGRVHNEGCRMPRSRMSSASSLICDSANSVRGLFGSSSRRSNDKTSERPSWLAAARVDDLVERAERSCASRGASGLASSSSICSAFDWLHGMRMARSCRCFKQSDSGPAACTFGPRKSRASLGDAERSQEPRVRVAHGFNSLQWH